jgi:hypothetical protein
MNYNDVCIVKVHLYDSDVCVQLYRLPDGTLVRTKREVLRHVFGTHMNLYSYLGIDERTARLLNWDPEGNSFDPSQSEGYRRFLRSHGEYDYEEVESYSMDLFLRGYLEEEGGK